MVEIPKEREQLSPEQQYIETSISYNRLSDKSSIESFDKQLLKYNQGWIDKLINKEQQAEANRQWGDLLYRQYRLKISNKGGMPLNPETIWENNEIINLLNDASLKLAFAKRFGNIETQERADQLLKSFNTRRKQMKDGKNVD